jgi:hypothetical protein
MQSFAYFWQDEQTIAAFDLKTFWSNFKFYNNFEQYSPRNVQWHYTSNTSRSKTTTAASLDIEKQGKRVIKDTLTSNPARKSRVLFKTRVTLFSFFRSFWSDPPNYKDFPSQFYLFQYSIPFIYFLCCLSIMFPEFKTYDMINLNENP